MTEITQPRNVRRGLKDGLGLRKLVSMPISEAARHDLSNGLTELLGLDRADTLMAYLPEFRSERCSPQDRHRRVEGSYQDRHRATRFGISDVSLEIKELRVEMTAGFAGVGEPIDRMFLTLVEAYS